MNKYHLLGMIDTIYKAFEDENSHDICAVLNWMFNLYPEGFFYGECLRIKQFFEKKVYTVKVRRDDKTGSWSQVKYKMVITFKEVK